jgi:DNA-binding transcriptional regulator YiaG
MNKPVRKPIEKKYRSPIMAAIHQTVEDLHAAGVVDNTTLHRFDETCLTPVPQREHHAQQDN